ncbi:anion permease [Pseudomonas sp. HN11]|nr:anion permease [Pseudomonas sp. HN11]
MMTWKDVQSRIPWGTVIVFGVGISLGPARLTRRPPQIPVGLRAYRA